MNKTKVVNVKVKYIRPRGYNNLREWCDCEDNVYIGRGGIVFVDGVRYPKHSSIWASPYPVKDYGLEKCLKKYEKYIRKELEGESIPLEKLKELKGKNLGCWCVDGETTNTENIVCHGQILLKLIEEFEL